AMSSRRLSSGSSQPRAPEPAEMDPGHKARARDDNVAVATETAHEGRASSLTGSPCRPHVGGRRLPFAVATPDTAGDGGDEPRQEVMHGQAQDVAQGAAQDTAQDAAAGNR